MALFTEMYTREIFWELSCTPIIYFPVYSQWQRATLMHMRKNVFKKKPCGVFSLSVVTHLIISLSPHIFRTVYESCNGKEALCSHKLSTSSLKEVQRKLLNVDERQKESKQIEKKSELCVWLKETLPVQRRWFLLCGCSNVWCLEQFVLSATPERRCRNKPRPSL